MVNRPDLHKTLIRILGSKSVYFQPPESTKLTYPCIIYEETKGRTTRANDLLYLYRKAYDGVIVDKDPDSEIPDKVRALPMCDIDRPYKADNLYHWPFTIFI